jgi:Zn-dependent metalloprotease
MTRHPLTGVRVNHSSLAPSGLLLRLTATLLAVALVPAVALGLPPTSERLAAIRADQPASISRAQSALLQRRDLVGGNVREGFAVRSHFVDAEGRTVIRFDQTFDGRPVWGSQAIVHVEPGGAVRPLAQGLRATLALPPGPPRLDPAQATTIALRDLAPRGRLGASPKVELVAFPSEFTAVLRVRPGSSPGSLALDRSPGPPVRRPAAPYVWAYQVRTFLFNGLDGHREQSYLIDAETGSILRRWSELQSVIAPPTAANGTGLSFYRGTVPLSTAVATDGSFALNATDRGTLPQPFVAAQGFTQVGLATYWAAVDLVANGLAFFPYEAHVTDTWGDGTVYPVAWDFVNGGMLWDQNAAATVEWPLGALTPSGETAAVDAHYGLSATWDFYRNVFGRDGIDDLGTSTLAIVHSLNGQASNPIPEVDNAHWSPWLFGMEFGDGSYPKDPAGLLALTELDITGHELSHGVTQETAALIYAGLPGGLNEASSDIMGKMVEAYTDGGGTGPVIAEFAGGGFEPWRIARHSVPDGGSLRSMYRPSLDGVSADAWYDGLEQADVHFSSGPINRMFFYLSQGGSSDPADPTYSVYLPGGMKGIGNDRAARIWFRALTEQFGPATNFETARAGAIAAAQELFSPGSAEEAAVMNAFAAVNVGAASGQQPRVKVVMPVVNPPGSFLFTNAVPDGVLSKVQIFPTRADVKVRVVVQNATDQRVTWVLGSPHGSYQAGNIDADGTWRTPSFPFYADLIAINATSVADPTQFARGQALLVELDADTDGEVDAIDLGSVAMAWGLKAMPPQPAVMVAGGGGPTAVDDWDLVFFTQGFMNAWAAQ